jgi:hypothetical protein
MGEATPEQRTTDKHGNLQCGVAKPLHEYVEQLLINAGLVDIGSNLLLEKEIARRIGEPDGFAVLA